MKQESFLFIAFLMTIGIIQSTYPKLVLQLYFSREYELTVDHFLKVVGNIRWNSKQRGLLRNIVFNVERNLTNEFVSWYFFNVKFTQEEIMFRAATVVAMTVFAQYYCNQEWFARYGTVLNFVFGFYVMTFSVMWVSAMDYYEQWGEGYLMRFLGWFFYIGGMHLQGDMIEDAIWGDLNCIGSPWANWPCFGGNLFGTLAGFAIYGYFTSFENVLRRPGDYDILGALGEGVLPFRYPRVNVFDPESIDQCGWTILNVTNAIGVIGGIYYNRGWLFAKSEPPKKQDSQKKATAEKPKSAKEKKNQ